MVSTILETIDTVKAELTSIEATGKESNAHHADLLRRLESAVCMAAPASVAPYSCSPVVPVEAAIDVLAAQDPSPAAVQKQPAPPDVSVLSPAANDGSAHKNGLPYGKRSTDVSTAGSVAESTIRVDVALLNRLMNLVGELVLVRNQILQFNAKREDAGLNTTAQKLNLITTELQEGVMRTRMQPISVIWNNLPRVVRDLANSQGKQIELQMEGADTELDKNDYRSDQGPSNAHHPQRL